eukprot:TRINITY_DN7083_c1_g2_i1.p1 TRINITY_DN7083_c1_g2~~TRINITY_DN7083_c1_g2_i1.p1  ORF type:complete len:506 (-),score=70.28 TRINITY_DN7083_c1_g2_i1:19-1536(-)
MNAPEIPDSVNTPVSDLDEPTSTMTSLTAWMHPSMEYPDESDFRFDAEANPIKVEGSQTIGELMELFEVALATASEGKLKVKVTVVWNLRDHQTALKPSDSVCKHFRNGDTLGVFGDIKLAQSLRFVVGTRVLCRVFCFSEDPRTGDMKWTAAENPHTGDAKWDAGTIIELNYMDGANPCPVPYLVMLDDGAEDLEYLVPEDVDYFCKQLVPPWWVSILTPINAAKQTTAELVKACQDRDVDEPDHLGETALLTAVSLNWVSGVQALLEMKAAVNSADSKGTFALHRACSCGPSMLGLLLAAKANPNLQDVDPDFDPNLTSATFGDHPEHRTPLHYTCLEGDLESSRLLVQSGADMNIQDGQRKTPLHLAIEEDHEVIIDFLLQSGVAVDLCSLSSGMKNSPLLDAARNGKHILAKKLLASGANVNKVGQQDMTALHLAARRGDAKTVKILLAARADASLESQIGTALQLASKHSSTELLHLFGIEACSARAPLTQAERAALYMD